MGYWVGGAIVVVILGSAVLAELVGPGRCDDYCWDDVIKQIGLWVAVIIGLVWGGIVVFGALGGGNDGSDDDG